MKMEYSYFMKKKGLRLLLISGMALLFYAVTLFFVEQAYAHGYMDSPASRALLCKQGENNNCGAVQYEPQSIEAKKGFPEAGPEDGKIASGGIFLELDEQTADRWKKVKLNGGMNTFKWYLTAPHASANWKYYITKKDWDPNKPLTRSALELEPFCVYDFEGKKPNTVTEHECEVPTDRSGYHIILGVWEIADTANAFYQVIDVDLANDGSGDHGSGDESKPTVPGNLSADSITSTSVSLKWASSTSPSGIKEYQIYQDHVLIGSTTNQSYRCSNLKPDTTYKFAVRAVDKKGKLSGLSNIVTVKTLPNSGNGGDAKYPAWDAKTVYLGGKRVQYNGSEYEARWWTLNEEPGRAEVWKKLK